MCVCVVVSNWLSCGQGCIGLVTAMFRLESYTDTMDTVRVDTVVFNVVSQGK